MFKHIHVYPLKPTQIDMIQELTTYIVLTIGTCGQNPREQGLTPPVVALSRFRFPICQSSNL